jgi:Xaa-Pro aminopeptidase
VDFTLRRERLAARLAPLGIDAMFITRLPNVRYLTGFSGSNGQLLLGGDDAVFLTDGRYAEQSKREVPEVKRGIYSSDFAGAFEQACHDAGLKRVGFESAGMTFRTYQKLSPMEGLELVPVGEEVEKLRWAKDREEIRAIDAAQAITDEAFQRILPKLVDGVTERDVALELDFSMRQAGADGMAFDPIVAFGENAAEPHHHPTERALQHGDVVKMDFGALKDGYHSDITRTVAFGDPPKQLEEIYALVRSSQQAGIDAVRAGVKGKDADGAARDIIKDGGFGDAFGHSLGHGVGLEIHEGPSLRSTSDEVLPAGAVVTVEPGVYVPGLGGVRIEDMVEVTEEGCRVITGSPKELITL